MKWEPLYYADKLCVLNPEGHIAFVTCWTTRQSVVAQLEKLPPEKFKHVAVVGNLYGRGISALLVNLLNNPQIDTVFVVGHDNGDAGSDFELFFANGVESAELHGVPCNKIVGTTRYIDAQLNTGLFNAPPRVIYMANDKMPTAEQMAGYAAFSQTSWPLTARDRVNVVLTENVKPTTRPSAVNEHTIIASDVVEAYRRLMHRLHFFGAQVQLTKGRRRELQNLRVVIRYPKVSNDVFEALAALGVNEPQMRAYAAELADMVCPAGITYTYGNRLHAYFGGDAVQKVIERLKADPEDRHSYIALWSTERDLLVGGSHPCWVSAYFRRCNGALNMTAVFRTHNAVDAWPINYCGLADLLCQVAKAVGMPVGALTLFSHSISIDDDDMTSGARSKAIAEEEDLRYPFATDPCGSFYIDVTDGKIVVEHQVNDVVLHVFEDVNAFALHRRIVSKGLVSDVGHAMYLGRMLERAENCLKTGSEFTQT